MKTLKRLLTIILMIAIAALAASCGMAESTDYPIGVGGDGYAPARDGVPSGMAGEVGGKTYEVAGEGYEGMEPDSPTGETTDDSVDDTEEHEEQIIRPAGLITASAWNDNQYYNYFLSMFEKGETTEQNDGSVTTTESGKFYNRLVGDNWGFDATHRVKITVTSEQSPVVGATVKYYGANQSERYAVTDANGVAYIFPDGESGTFTVASGIYSQTGAFDKENTDVKVELTNFTAKDNVIKLMFVVDVTGSMGDEMSYLSNELNDVINRVVAANPNVRIDLAYLFYRDDGDNEKFAYFDFLTVTENYKNFSAQLKNLSVQRADGGGDYPEALDEALELAVNKDWGEENSTRIIFHVYDAPPHTTAKNKTTYENAVRTAAKKGIRINPVLCSGADELCEYIARQAAIHTAGHFVYVTDDSGIGNSHYDPNLPNAVVERLNDLMIRLINGYHSGEFAAAVDWRQAVKEQQ